MAILRQCRDGPAKDGRGPVLYPPKESPACGSYSDAHDRAGQPNHPLAFIGQVWNQGDLVQLEKIGFEVLLEGGERGVGHGSNQPKIGIIFPYLCPYRLKGLGQIFEQVVEKKHV